MRTILLILLIALAGCSVSRKATSDKRLSFTDKSEINTSATLDTSRLKASADQRESKQDSIAGEVKIEREYDTDKPVNPVTGKPPLKKETITGNGIKVSKVDKKESGDLEIDKNLSATVDNSRLNQTGDVKIYTTEAEKKKPPAAIIFWSLVVITLCIYFKKKFL